MISSLHTILQFTNNADKKIEIRKKSTPGPTLAIHTTAWFIIHYPSFQLDLKAQLELSADIVPSRCSNHDEAALFYVPSGQENSNHLL